jgi:hypothetical protein
MDSTRVPRWLGECDVLAPVDTCRGSGRVMSARRHAVSPVAVIASAVILAIWFGYLKMDPPMSGSWSR